MRRLRLQRPHWPHRLAVAVLVGMLGAALCTSLTWVALPAGAAPAGPAGPAAGGGTPAPVSPTASTAPLEEPASPLPRIIPLPNTGQAPRDEGDRGGFLQVSLFWFILAALALLGLLAYRDGLRKRRRAMAARAARAGASSRPAANPAASAAAGGQ